MGRSLTHDEHQSLVEWSNGSINCELDDASDLTPSKIRSQINFELNQYFRLCGLARSTSAEKTLRDKANRRVFNVRIRLETSIISLIWSSINDERSTVQSVLGNGFFGNSKKQGVSLRLPLNSCMATKLCASACYAHDVLDAAPNSVIRGSINGWFAEYFEQSSEQDRLSLLQVLKPQIIRATRSAIAEANNIKSSFSRSPYIRFSHVGELANYPDFANALATAVRDLSDDRVACVIYTRHQKASLLDPDLWVVNFTLDPQSENRRAWAPNSARIVYSAFDGLISSTAAVNFLEHHRHSHVKAKGDNGKICPATAPETVERTCDACRCDLCFRAPGIEQ